MLADNLKQLLKKHDKNQAELAAFVGVKANTVSDWLKKGNSPKVEHLYRIAEFFNVDFNVLFFGETKGEQDDPNARQLLEIFESLDDEGKTIIRAASYYARDRLLFARNKAIAKSPSFKGAPNDIRPVIVYDMPASAGTGQFLDSEDYVVMDFPAADIPLQATFGVRITGDSMSPEILDGDIALVQQQPAINENEIGVFLFNGNCYCKRYIKENGRPFLASINPRYDPIPIQEYDELRTVGKVVGMMKE